MKSTSYKNFDWLLFILVLILIIFGLLNIYSASVTQDVSGLPYYVRQFCWVLIGLSLLVIIYGMNFQLFVRFAYHYYWINIAILILLLALSVSKADTSRWFFLGPFVLQPSEFSKLAVILALARYLQDKEGKLKNFSDIIIPVSIVALPFFLVLKQPNLGTALVFIPVLFVFFYICDLPGQYLFYLVAPVISLILFKLYLVWFIFIVFLVFILYIFKTGGIDRWIVFIFSAVLGLAQPVFWDFLKDYQKKRIMVFFNPNIDPLGSSYSVIQSKIAVGSGKFLGKGWLHGTQNRLNFIPEHHTDFIFSVIGEEWGFVGGFLVLLLFFILIMQMINIALQSRNRFGTLTATGISVIFVFHVVENIGMSMGIAPVTGLPLPFLSYGGSALLSFLIMIGVLEKIRDER